MRKVLATLEGSVLVQVQDELWVFYEHNMTSSLEDLDAQAWECEAQVKILPNNKIQILQLQELYQFNCCHSLLTTIKLLAIGLKINGQDVSKIESYLSNPETYFAEPLSQVSFSFKKEVENIMFDALYQFNYKNKQIKGHGQFIKYTYFEDIETVPESIEEVFDLYVNLNKLIAEACTIGKDDMMLPCDKWARRENV